MEIKTWQLCLLTCSMFLRIWKLWIEGSVLQWIPICFDKQGKLAVFVILLLHWLNSQKQEVLSNRKQIFSPKISEEVLLIQHKLLCPDDGWGVLQFLEWSLSQMWGEWARVHCWEHFHTGSQVHKGNTHRQTGEQTTMTDTACLVHQFYQRHVKGVKLYKRETCMLFSVSRYIYILMM